MLASVPRWSFALAALVALAACQSPDVGQPCKIAWNSTWEGDPSMPPPPDPVTLEADYFESGNLACENLVCIVSPAREGTRYASGGYCSKPCVSNEDCYESETGLVCRQMLLDEAFIAKLDPTVREQYVPNFRASSYCAVP